MADPLSIRTLSAVTLAVREMARSVAFYRALGFEVEYGGPDANFTSLRVGDGHLNLFRAEVASDHCRNWGRFIVFVSDVDAMYDRAVASGARPQFAPRDGAWGERYFHLNDPDGHEMSFACPI